ncbi:S-layer homology domain-containing protein [Candidatus Peregrinibacteria bacterium]|nr:S-layer homology domain-containing protein [Candidatus Peregrinibacteria bacterium]
MRIGHKIFCLFFKVAPCWRAICLASLWLGLITLPAVALANFSDVPETHKHALAIQTLKDAGMVSGYGDETFKPDQPVSRAEATAVILKAVGITATKTSAKLPFSDVPEDAWYFPMIQYGVSIGKLKGYEDKTFRPDKPVTLPEALALTVSFYKVGVKKVDVAPVIYDGLDTKAWYSKQAQFAKNKNLIEPDVNGHIDPAKSLTRGELAELIYRMRIFQQTQRPFDITAGWIETEHLDNFWKIKHPPDWEIFKGQKNSVIWKRSLMQAFFTRLWPKNARLSISLVDNPENLTAVQYFAKLRDAYTASYPELKVIFVETTLGGKTAIRISVHNRHIMDAAIALPNKNFLMIYGEYGEAPIGEFLKKQIDAMILSYQYVERPPGPPPPPPIPLEQRMETLRENILVADKWKDITPLFPDKKLINTDAIGIGTGPVDYYYSAEANHTIKLERNSGTVLNIREGETNSF